MKISIIVPVYNKEKTLDKCLQSIKNQYLTDWECIIIDDGSTDSSLSICKKYEASDSRFKVVHKENSGVANTRNLGLSLATGEWIGFVDSDDWINPNMFSKMISEGEKENIDYVQCSFTLINNEKISGAWIYPKGKYTIEDGIQLSDSKHDIGHSINKIYKSYLLKNIKFADCDFCEDLFLNIQVYIKYGKLLVLEDQLYNYRRDDENSLSRKKLSKDRRLNFIKTYDKIVKKISRYKNFKYIKELFAEFVDKALAKHSEENTVDFIFPYVDSSDPNWQSLYNKEKYHIEDAIENSNHRFNGNNDLLKYIFRGIEKNMPFISVIHFIVQSESQIPDWLDTSKVHIVYHDSYIPKEFLPTFNSCTIEAFIPKIVGLSEKFIYSNDDCYPIYELKSKFFFDDRDLPKLKYNIGKINKNNQTAVWYKLFNNSLNLAKKITQNYKDLCNKNEWVSPSHIMLGHRKSLWKEAFTKAKEEIYNSISEFREEKNISEYFYFWYEVLSNNYFNDVYLFKYMNFDKYSSEEVAKVITNKIILPNNKHYRTVCINDTSEKEQDLVPIFNAFNELYPNKCTFEK